MIDGTIVKVHRHGQGAKGGLRARPWAARAALIEGRAFEGLIADKAFNVNWIVDELERRQAEIRCCGSDVI